MNNCVCCGSSIPEGQTTCSMCYGDMNHGQDGYYRQWAERQLEEQQRNNSGEGGE